MNFHNMYTKMSPQPMIRKSITYILEASIIVPPTPITAHTLQSNHYPDF